MDIGWIVACAAGTLFVRAGLALYTCGMVRAKNAGAALLRHVADLCLAVMAFWAVGLAVLNLNGDAILLRARDLAGLHGERIMLAPYALLAMTAMLVSTGIVVGALSERSRFWPSLAPSFLLGGILVPLLARWCWPTGWLGRLHFHDYAGASYIHVAAGTCAAVGAIAFGPRGGKYNRDGSSNVIPSHNLPLAGAGVLLMLVGWFPYLLGFAGFSLGAPYTSIALIAMNALLAAAAAGTASLIVSHVRYGKPDIYLAITSVLGGLVSITAGADLMTNLAAVTTGAIAGVLVSWVLLQIDLVWKLDDPTGALAIHGIGGAWAILAAGLFGSTARAGGRFKLLGAQALGLVVVVACSVVLSAAVFFVLKRFVTLRSREADEFDGLDLAEHDIGSYPDFQQTMIKSYHLREA